jgi:hypothetical protein
MTMEHDNLHQVERRIRRGLQLIIDQELRIYRMEVAGMNVAKAKEVLTILESTLGGLREIRCAILTRTVTKPRATA